jgi:hypothetical protein
MWRGSISLRTGPVSCFREYGKEPSGFHERHNSSLGTDRHFSRNSPLQDSSLKRVLSHCFLSQFIAILPRQQWDGIFVQLECLSGLSKVSSLFQRNIKDVCHCSVCHGLYPEVTARLWDPVSVSPQAVRSLLLWLHT